MVIVVSLDIALEAFGVGANDKIFDKVVGGVVVVAVTVVANESIFGKVVVGTIVAAVVVVVIVVAYDKIFASVEDGAVVGVVLDAFADANIVTEGAVDASTILLTSAVSLSTASSRSRTRSASRRPLKRAPSISKNDFYGYTVSPFNENIPKS